MGLLGNLLQIITYNENPDKEGFVLTETESEKSASRQQKDDESERRSAKRQSLDNTAPRPKFKAGFSRRLGLKSKNMKTQPKSNGREKTNNNAHQSDDLTASLEKNREALHRFYRLPLNTDVDIRDFALGTVPPVRGFAIYINSITNKEIQNMLFQALMIFSAETPNPGVNRLAGMVSERLLPSSTVENCDSFRAVLDAVNDGDTVIFLEGLDRAIAVDTRGFTNRNIEKPTIEQAIRAPQEGFGETLRKNLSLVRKHFRNESLVTESLKVGYRNRANVAVIYVHGLINPELVAEVKRRINSIRTDLVNDSGILEQFIEDYPYSLLPQVLATERPDRVIASLAEGRAAILVDGSPFALIVPATMYNFLNTGEENYLRWQYGTFVRYIRVVAYNLALLLPGVYLAAVLHHHEMIPTELLLAIAASREGVPFPSVIEVLIMEISFELVREAGLRLPGFMGSTIGIVGALILGQAAVQAHLVSPILVILVAVTGLSSFAIPNYSLQFALRISRFFYIALGATLGFFGIIMGLAAQVIMAASIKSFGVPYLSPIGPQTTISSDLINRFPVFSQEKRSDAINPRDTFRQPKVSRGWVNQKGNKRD